MEPEEVEGPAAVQPVLVAGVSLLFGKSFSHFLECEMLE